MSYTITISYIKCLGYTTYLLDGGVFLQELLRIRKLRRLPFKVEFPT